MEPRLKSMHSTTLSSLHVLSVETTVCITNVVTQVTGRLSLNILVSILIFTVSLDYCENFRNGLICNCGKMNFWIKYLGKSILEKYLPFAQDSFKKYLELKILR